MIQKKLTIINKLGLHARAAMKLTNLATRYQSDIRIKYHQREVSAKDILDVMVLAVSQGNEIELIIAGEDEEEASNAIEKLIYNRFGEAI